VTRRTVDYGVFGPQGRYVEALLNRCEVVTPQEAELRISEWCPEMRW
jgi:hypothetical protein